MNEGVGMQRWYFSWPLVPTLSLVPRPHNGQMSWAGAGAGPTLGWERRADGEGWSPRLAAVLRGVALCFVLQPQPARSSAEADCTPGNTRRYTAGNFGEMETIICIIFVHEQTLTFIFIPLWHQTTQHHGPWFIMGMENIVFWGKVSSK